MQQEAEGQDSIITDHRRVDLNKLEVFDKPQTTDGST